MSLEVKKRRRRRWRRLKARVRGRRVKKVIFGPWVRRLVMTAVLGGCV